MKNYIEQPDSEMGKIAPILDYSNILEDSASFQRIYNTFGEYSNNVIEFSIYNENDELIHFETQYPTSKYLPVAREYFDINNTKKEYTYDKFYGNIISEIDPTKKQSIFLPFSQDLQKNNLFNGNFTLSYQPKTLIVGDSENGLKIKEISPSGTEIKVSCENSSIIDEFNAICDNKSKVKYNIPSILGLLNDKSVYPNFKDTTGTPEINKVKYEYAFTSEVEILFFLYDIINGYSVGKNKSNGSPASDSLIGLKYLIENFLYENYEKYFTVDELFNQCVKLSNELVSKTLAKISYVNDTAYFNEVLFNFLKDIFDVVKKSDNFVNFAPLKTYMTFIGGNSIPILNKTSFVDVDGQRILVLKLAERDSSLDVDMTFYINKITFFGTYQKVFSYIETNLTTKKLRSANFSNIGLVDYSLGAMLGDENDSPNYSGVDYRYFSNFIRFSSAEWRLTIYSAKKAELTNLRTELEYNAIGTQEYNKIYSDIDYIISTFDGYEQFLESNPNWYAIHSDETNGVANSVSYDISNLDSLVNTSPSMTNSEENSEYITFLNMIGHMFDEIFIKISNFPANSKIQNTEEVVHSNEIMHQLLESCGWNISDSTIIKNKEYSRLLWNRFLCEHPFILKEKGTRKSIESIISCYGIPHDIISVREYSIVSDESYRTYENEKISFSPEIKKYNEFIQIQNVSDIKTIQFKFASPTGSLPNGTILRLLQCDNDWSIGVIKRKNGYSSPFFTIKDSSNSINTVILNDIPTFDNSIHNVTLRKKTSVSSSLVPHEIELIVNRTSFNEVTHIESKSIFISGSFLDAFSSGSKTLYAGNYSASTTEYFSGNLDDIKIWNSYISDSDLANQNFSIGNYSSDNIDLVTQSLFFALNFDAPIDLFTTSSMKVIENKCPNTQSISNCEFYNFRTGSIRYYVDTKLNVTSSTYYPYQFTRNEATELLTVPNISTENVNSSRIKKIENSSDIILSPSVATNFDSQLVNIKKLGVVLQPSNQIEKTFKLISGVDFSSIFGDPKNESLSSYIGLESFKRTYKKYLPTLKNINIYTNHIKNYVDPELFEDIKKVTPVKANLVSGILVEGGILEKNKYSMKPVTSGVHNKFDKIVGVSPTIGGTSKSNYVATLSPNVEGKFNDTSNFPYRFETMDSNAIGKFGNYTEYSPIGGYYFENGTDYYIDTYTQKIIREFEDGSTSTKNIKRKNVIKFPDVNMVHFTGTLNGNFSGSYYDIGSGFYSVIGTFNGYISTGSSLVLNQVMSDMTISGSYSGIPPSSSMLTTDFSSFVGTLATSVDFYTWAQSNIQGNIINKFRKSEKLDKFNKIQKNTPLIGRSNLDIKRIIRNKTVRSQYIWNQQTSNTTIDDESGLPNSSLPIISTSVDRGRAVVSSQGNGNVLSS